MSELRIPVLSIEEISKVSAPLTEAFTMPPTAYISETVFALEQENIFRKSWIPLARVEQLKEPGNFITVDLAGQSVIVVRGKDQEIRVLSNVCLHRAAILVEGEGKVHKFTCPYHAWSYDTTGQLIVAPMMEGTNKFDTKKCQLPHIRSEIWQGFIMANLDEDAETFAPQVEGLATYFENFQIQNHVLVRTLEFDSHWNWKVLVENFIEAYHHIATHSQTLQPNFPARDSSAQDNTGPWAILAMPGLDNHDDDDGLPMTKGLTELEQRSLYANVIFPYFIFAVQNNVLIWYQVLPNSAGNLLLRIHVCIHVDNLDFPNLDEQLEGTEAILNIVHGEDIGVNDRVWQGLNSPLTRQGRLSTYEKPIWQLNQWWLDKMGMR